LAAFREVGAHSGLRRHCKLMWEMLAPLVHNQHAMRIYSRSWSA